MALTRLNHGLYTGTKGIFLGLASAAAKAVLPAKVMPVQQEGTASIIAALAIGKFMYGALVCDKQGCDPVRKDLNVGNHFTLFEFFGRAAFLTFSPFVSQMTEADYHRSGREAVESFEKMYLLNLVLSFGENLAASMIGHTALSLMQFSTFSIQQVAVDACVATLPSLVPLRI